MTLLAPLQPRLLALLGASALALGQVACVPTDPGDDDATADDDDDSGPPPVIGFEDVTEASGLMAHELGGLGVAVGDVDGDGLPDLVLTGLGGPAGVNGPSRLFMNVGGGVFQDETASRAPSLPGGAMGATFADVDNDGDQDLFVAMAGTNAFFRNEDGFLDSQGAEAGVATVHPEPLLTPVITLGDYDGDGWLDAWVVNHDYQSMEPGDDPGGKDGEFPADEILHNRGDGTFEDASGIIDEALRRGAGFMAGWTDVDDDGDLDVYVTNDHGAWVLSNQLFVNEGPSPEGHLFTPRSETCGCDLRIASMGLGIADYDADGFLDFYVTNMNGEKLLRGLGDGQYLETTLTDGAVAAQEPERIVSWGVEFFDYDNDGWPDLHVVFGDKYDNEPAPNALLRNLGGRFERVSAPGLDDVWGDSRGMTVLDFDRDGCMDVVVANRETHPTLHRNRCDPDQAWIGLELVGTDSPRDPAGARVSVSTGDHVQVREHSVGSSSTHSCRGKPLHFGLGDVDRIDRIEIRWPSGLVEELTDVEPNRYLELVEGDQAR
jgi:enediyne biosynthesis protein E4